MMEIVEVTWARALRVWWSFTWRALLMALLVGFVTGLLGWMLQRLLGVDLQVLISFVSLLAGLGAGVWAMKKVLYKRFADFSVVLIANN